MRQNDKNTLTRVNPKMSDRVKYNVLFWGFTALTGLYIIPIFILVALNPFWFRNYTERAFKREIDRVSRVRGLLVKPIIDKYLAFEILKNS